MQDSWRAGDRLTLELGLRYDYYSVVREADDRAKPFFVEENDFGNVGDNFYNADKNNFSPRLSAAYQLNDKTVRARAASGSSTAPASSRIASSRSRTTSTAAASRPRTSANNGLRIRWIPATDARNLLSIRGYTHNYPNEYNMQYGVSVSRELPGDVNLTVGYTGSQGNDMFLRGVGNVLDPVTRVRPVPRYGQIDFKTAGCVDGVDSPASTRPPAAATAQYDALQISATRRFRSGLHRRLPVSVSRATRAPRRARTRRRRRRTRSTSRPSTAPIRRTSRTRSTARSST